MKLPVSDFKWVKKKKYAKNPLHFINKINVEGKKGYLLEVDLLYPKKIQKKHKHFPLAPHTVEIKYENLSPYAQDALIKTGGKKNYKSQKLIGSFLPREKYVLHIKNLKMYLKLGMKLKKVHRILQFKQEAFLKPYIDLCTEKRRNAMTKFEKNFYKLMCNAG